MAHRHECIAARGVYHGAWDWMAPRINWMNADAACIEHRHDGVKAVKGHINILLRGLL